MSDDAFQTPANHSPMSRRAVLGAGALAAGAGVSFVGAALAGDKGHEGHMDHMNHAEHMNHAGHGASSSHKALIDAAALCLKEGEICAAHCVASLGTGDTSLKACLTTVMATLPMCDALMRFAAMDAPRLKELAKVCRDVCDDCEKECKKHAEHHAVCKACGEACAACIKECDKLTKA